MQAKRDDCLDVGDASEGIKFRSTLQHFKLGDWSMDQQRVVWLQSYTFDVGTPRDTSAQDSQSVEPKTLTKLKLLQRLTNKGRTWGQSHLSHRNLV